MNPYHLKLGQTVLVNTRSGDGLVGTVGEITRHYLFLAEPKLVRRNGTGTDALDGTVKIPNDNIAWIQVAG